MYNKLNRYSQPVSQADTHTRLLTSPNLTLPPRFHCLPALDGKAQQQGNNRKVAGDGDGGNAEGKETVTLVQREGTKEGVVVENTCGSGREKRQEEMRI